jgi:hypothetical protein
MHTDNDLPFPDGASLDDAVLTLEELGDRYSWFDRFPEWRVLYQTRLWVNGNREGMVLDDLPSDDLLALQAYLRSLAPTLHAQAAQDEEYALSSAMRWTCHALGIPLVNAHHPLVWLDSTPLMWELDRRTAEAAKWPAYGVEDARGGQPNTEGER